VDLELTPEQQALREEVLRLAVAELSPGARERDASGGFPRELWRRCGRLGLQGLPVPEAYGGRGLDASSCAVALEALGEGCADGGLVFAIGAHLCSCVVPIWRHGSEAQKRRWLPALCDGRRVASHAMTEAGSGSDAFAMLTRAERDGAGFRLNGVKAFVSNAPVADLALVFALTDRERGFFGGVTAFLVEAGTTGMRAGADQPKLGLRTCPMSELILEDVQVGPDAVLGGVGGGAAVFAGAMDWERTLIFASHVGAMQRLLETSVSHARSRRQFGRPIGAFQGVAHRVADMAVRVEAARLLAYRAAGRLARPGGATLEAAMAKLFASESLVGTALDALQVLGGRGYLVDHDVERALRDAVASTLYSGTSEMQRSIIARLLGLQ
jgi:alkylation response protein AidB-like acyl-CoA dehydrogenase